MFFRYVDVDYLAIEIIRGAISFCLSSCPEVLSRVGGVA